MKMRKMEFLSLVLILAVSLITGAANADVTTDLVGHWKLDDGAGTTAIDSSGYGNDGTLEGSPEWKTTGDDFKIGSGALYFDFVTDVSSDYVDCGDAPEFDITTNITLAFWVKSDGFNVNYQYFFSKSTGNAVGGYGILRNAETGNLIFICGGLPGDYYAIGTTAIDDGQWHHIAGSYDSATGTVSFYVDGILEASATTSGDLITNDLSLQIGGRDVMNCNAFIDDARIYNRTLDADDIMELFLYRGNTATNIAPTNGAELVAIDTNLVWGPPPVFTPTKYDLRYKAGDPNFATGTVTEVFDIAYADPCNVYNPAADFANDTTIYWRVDTYAPSYPSDPCVGQVWSFTTAPAEPVITKDPVPLTVAIGGTAEFTVEDVGGTAYVWKKQSDNTTVGGNSSTLTLTDVQKADEDSYYCIVSNASGSAPPSAAATLWTERLIARWEFEDDLLDAEADNWDGVYTDPNTANEPPTPVFVLDPCSIDGGKALQLTADVLHVRITDSEDYFNFYPQGYTINAWVKTGQADAYGAMASKQDRSGESSDWKGWILNCTNDNGKAVNSLRQVVSATGTTNVADDQWRMVTGTYDAETGVVAVYVDGKLETESAPISDVAPTNAYPVVFGAGAVLAETSTYEGLLDKVSIYSYALSPIDVAVLYTDVMTGESICVEQPERDFDGNCRVDMLDFAMFATGWLECNRVPSCIP